MKQKNSSLPKWVRLLLAAWLTVALPVAGWAQEPSNTQPLDFMMVEALLGIQGAVIGSGLGIFVTRQTLDVLNDCDELLAEEVEGCNLAQSWQALCLGSAMGAPAGATFLGMGLSRMVLDTDGNLWAALLGSMLGQLVGMPQCSLISGLQQLGFPVSSTPAAESDWSLLINPFFLSAVGAVLGYNLPHFLGGNGAANR